MKLKYIELFGFKSFAEKTKLSFYKDITAIVGPNGSGKSNIADAIKWVLGEQSAKSLRGSNMQDVIFSGTESKKQMNMAQVSLILDNSDKSLPIAFDEVNVTRRVYRTGESEYLINKSPVRLRDIRELFLDTGIGKEGYSMIGQGRIDEILNGRNEDRRYIFEEACGISKNKYKKEESEKRLLKNEENLNTLAQEIKIKQQETDILQKQSENAKEGIQLTSRLEQLELNILKKSIEKVDQDLIKDTSSLEYIDISLSESTNELSKLIEKTTPITLKIEEKDKELEQLKNFLNESDRKIQSIDSEIDITNEKLRFYNLDIDRLESELEIKKNRISDSDVKLEAKNQQYKKLIEDKEEYTIKISNNEKQLLKIDKRYQDISVQINTLDEDINLQKDRLANLKIDKSTKEKLDISNEKLKLSYENELVNLDKNIEDRLEKIKELNLDINKIDEKLSANASMITDEIGLREKISNKLNLQQEKITFSRNQIIKSESKLDVLERQYKSYDGYYKSVQNLLKISDKNKSIKDKIIGVLADLINVEDEHKVAVDVALGSALQNIVIQNEEDGKYLIDFIKQQKIGRITFLPINKIKSYKSEVNHPKAIDTLNNLVTYDERIGNIIDYFLSKTILVNNMSDAIIVSRETKAYRVITLDGEVINSWGSMVGGNTFKRDSNSLLNRKKEINDLRKSINTAKKDLSSNIEEFNRNREKYDNIIHKLSELDHKNNELLSEKRSINSQIQEINIEKNFNRQRKEEFQLLLDNINNELRDLDFSDIEKINLNISEQEFESNELTKEKDNLSESKSSIERELIRLKASLEVVIRDISILENDIEDLEFSLDDNKKNIDLDKSNLDYTYEEINKSNKLIDSLNKSKIELQDKLSNSESLVKDLDSELLEYRQEIKIDSARIEELKNNISDNEKEKFKLELRIDNAKEKVENLKSDYMETYSIEEFLLDEKLNKLEDTNATRKEVLEIKNRLSQIGYFNFETIEQYNIILEELNFMKSQYEDLINTRNDIIKMIKEIEEDMIETFTTTFAKIQIRFDEIFNILFNGGQAELKLDSDDILSAGIEIIARPPGKKLTNLALLSGGEKALTAVALLFAIFEINPAPFCVLDEIDAALDESNIKRYFDYLKSLVGKTQFIIITHRKVSMEMADILYGITMEDHGVSKVITLMLEEYNE